MTSFTHGTTQSAWDGFNDLKNIFAEKFGKNIGVFCTASFCKKMYDKTPFF
jgi:hypothetical protein